MWEQLRPNTLLKRRPLKKLVSSVVRRLFACGREKDNKFPAQHVRPLSALLLTRDNSWDREKRISSSAYSAALVCCCYVTF